MKRRIEFTRRGARQFRSLTPPVRTRVGEALRRFAEEGRGDIDRMEGEARLWRLRTGDWRILVEISRIDPIIWVHGVGHRRDIYRRM